MKPSVRHPQNLRRAGEEPCLLYHLVTDPHPTLGVVSRGRLYGYRILVILHIPESLQTLSEYYTRNSVVEDFESELYKLTDFDFAEDRTDHKSTSSFAFLVSYEVLSWLSRKKVVVTQ